MDKQEVGSQIALLRKAKGLTQNELGERLNISYQAVSKWERGEALPDVTILPALADVLETTVDYILCGARKAMTYRGKVTVAQCREGIRCLGRMGELLGKDNIIYRYAIEGINERMNTNIEDAFVDDYMFECFVGEAVVQCLRAGAYVDPTDVRNSFYYDHFRELTLERVKQCGIV